VDIIKHKRDRECVIVHKEEINICIVRLNRSFKYPVEIKKHNLLKETSG
jgi:hypothetical protein